MTKRRLEDIATALFFFPAAYLYIGGWELCMAKGAAAALLHLGIPGVLMASGIALWIYTQRSRRA